MSLYKLIEIVNYRCLKTSYLDENPVSSATIWGEIFSGPQHLNLGIVGLGHLSV